MHCFLIQKNVQTTECAVEQPRISEEKKICLSTVYMTSVCWNYSQDGLHLISAEEAAEVAWEKGGVGPPA